MAFSLLDYVGQNALVKGMQLGKSSMMSMIVQSGVVYAFLVDIFIFGHQFGSRQLIGAGIILTFGVLMMLQKLMCNKDQVPQIIDKEEEDDKFERYMAEEE